ncbi:MULTISPECIES: CPBP family intramembrane glutamic endopeptidase [Niallia]|uniref:CPBP family intramembrane metalloprotease n=1 Tax=Niallia taxi TaxID=2499688 RepID=A0A437K7Y9_9BACI|nr:MULTISPECIES: CPBP family intramembrane glutamic endopeptidase [Niallia]MDK8642416.1 CPBP family intramembrane metalloprotease [Niallia taxi]MED4040606.1 CPBP family intramembrane metalloprotease [Niallia taxi]MED4057046.1 CPBP family intramembrane metalloprotease [Niallia taxi]MED4121608.1 CPBP family intramembrane metalloprotease [Niallia taxi]RVT59555.1 CPBP family intramembrane metalloprotease [Niallia taxi]
MKHLIKNKYIWIFATYILIMTVVPRGLKFVLYLGDVGKTEHLAFKNYHVENDLLIIWLNISIQLLILGFVFFLYSSTSVFTWKRPIVKGKDFLNALYIFLWKILVSGIAGIVFVFINGGLGDATPQNQQNLEVAIQTSLVTVISTVILAPIIEEFFFRKILIGHIFASHPYIGLMLSSLIFGGLHLVSGFSVVGLIIYCGMGLFLGLLYLKTNRLESSMIAHSFNNLISSLRILIQ